MIQLIIKIVFDYYNVKIINKIFYTKSIDLCSFTFFKIDYRYLKRLLYFISLHIGSVILEKMCCILILMLKKKRYYYFASLINAIKETHLLFCIF